MSMPGMQIKELRWLAGHLDETERGMDEYVRAMREAADTIEKLEPHSNQLEPSRYFQLFGTPERAARTITRMQMATDLMGCCDADSCPAAFNECWKLDSCPMDDYDKLLEWLRGDA